MNNKTKFGLLTLGIAFSCAAFSGSFINKTQDVHALKIIEENTVVISFEGENFEKMRNFYNPTYERIGSTISVDADNPSYGFYMDTNNQGHLSYTSSNGESCGTIGFYFSPVAQVAGYDMPLICYNASYEPYASIQINLDQSDRALRGVKFNVLTNAPAGSYSTQIQRCVISIPAEGGSEEGGSGTPHREFYTSNISVLDDTFETPPKGTTLSVYPLEPSTHSGFFLRSIELTLAETSISSWLDGFDGKEKVFINGSEDTVTVSNPNAYTSTQYTEISTSKPMYLFDKPDDYLYIFKGTFIAETSPLMYFAKPSDVEKTYFLYFQDCCFVGENNTAINFFRSLVEIDGADGKKTYSSSSTQTKFRVALAGSVIIGAQSAPAIELTNRNGEFPCDVQFGTFSEAQFALFRTDRAAGILNRQNGFSTIPSSCSLDYQSSSLFSFSEAGMYNIDGNTFNPTDTDSNNRLTPEVARNIVDTRVNGFVKNMGEGLIMTMANSENNNSRYAMYYTDFSYKHSLEWVPQITGSCVSGGNHEYNYDSQTNNWFMNFDSYTYVCTEDDCKTPPTGIHNFSIIDYQWSDDLTSCTGIVRCAATGCDESISEEATVIEFSRTEPTCVSNGVITYQAIFAEDSIFETQMRSKSIPATGIHNLDYTRAQYEWSPDLCECYALVPCTNSEYGEVHYETFYATITSSSVNPSCTQDGKTILTATFNNENLATQTREIVSSPATGHMWGDYDYQWSEDFSRCTATAHCKNPGCSKTTTQTIDAQLVLDTSPTCNTDGRKVYEANFGANSIFETQRHEETTPATGEHNLDYGKVRYNWNQDHSQCIAQIPCYGEDGKVAHYVEVAATLSYQITQQPTCTQTGVASIVATFDDPNLRTQYVASGTIAALGHDFGDPIYKWNEDLSECTAKIICKRDKSHVITEVANVDNGKLVTNVTKEAECEEKGSQIITATFTNSLFENQTKTLDIDAKGHTPELDGEGNQKYYTDDTYHWQNCTECGAEQINKSEHNFVLQSMANNDTEYHVVKKCSVCGKTSEEYIDKSGGVQDVAKGLISTTADSGVEASTLNDAIDNLAGDEESAEQLNTIVDTIASSMGAVSEMQEALASAGSEEEKAQIQAQIEEAVEIVSIVAESSVVIASDAKENATVAENLNNSLPADADIDMGEVFNDFYAKVMSELLGTSSSQQKMIKKGLIKRSETPAPANQIDFSLGAETYKKAMEFADTSVDNMTNAVSELRTCSGEKITKQVKNYVETVKVSSFRDFNKEEADKAFFENAYNAVMLELQQRVTNTLDEEYNTAKKDLKGTQLDELTEKYNEERAAVQDMEEFTIMIKEIMRQKYVSIINNRYDNGMLDNDEYAEAMALAADVNSFGDVYVEIFKAWCLKRECPYEVTLEELTNATIENTSLRRFPPKEYEGGISGGEIALLASFGVLVAGALVFGKVYRPKNKKGAK